MINSDLLESLRQRVETTLVQLIAKNRHTRYVSDSPVFIDFRSALGDAVTDQSLVQIFCATVPLTSYDSYEPFITKLVTHNPRESDVRDMFSPGLPNFVAVSSATSGKKPKLFAKYRHPSNTSLKAVDEHANPVCVQGSKNCVIYSLTYQEVVDVISDDKALIGRIPITAMSSGVIRMQHGLDIDKDPWVINLTAPRATSPMAVSFIVNYRSFLLMHLVFALADPELGTITTLFGTVFLDMVRYMEEEWDTLVHSIEIGVLPDWDGTSHVRQYLEPKFSAKPERAAHLRAVGKVIDQPGWLKRLWPHLNVVVGIASGVFSAIIPKMKHYLGPDVRMSSLGFTASEAYIGTAFDSTDLSLFKATSDDIIEYLDVSKAETASNLCFAHEVEVGRRYEIVVTTRDGLWRYRLGDVIEIAGFDPTDGTPILRYIERRGASLRLPNALISEEELANAVLAAQDVLGPITEFTVFVDDRTTPSSLAFLVEMDGMLPATTDHASAHIQASLRRSNDNVKDAFDRGKLAPPMVYVLKPGTFREYRALKIKATPTGTGQVKVPVVLWDHDAQEWMLRRINGVMVR